MTLYNRVRSATPIPLRGVGQPVARRIRRWWWEDVHRVSCRTVFVVGNARSGTSLFLDWLACHRGAWVRGEILHPNYLEAKHGRQLVGDAAIDHMEAALPPPIAPLRAAKLMLRHLEAARLSPTRVHEQFPDAYWIVVHRRDVAATYVSWQAAVDTGQWEFAGEPTPRRSVTVDPERFLAKATEWRDQYEALLAETWVAERTVVLAYEDLIAAPDRWFRDVISPWLGLSAPRLRTDMVRQRTDPLDEIVTNWRDVADVLSGPEGLLRLPVGLLR